MKNNRKISEVALRQLVNEVLEGHPGGRTWEPSIDSTKVSAIVDPQEDDVAPMNPDHVPQDKVEMGVAFKNLVKNVPDARMSNIYKAIKDAVVLDAKRAEKEAEMKEKNVKKSPQVEEALRREIRKILREAAPGSEFRGMDYFGEPDAEEDKAKQKYTSTVGVTDNVRSQPDVAGELGISAAKLNQYEQIYRVKRGYLRDGERGAKIMKQARDGYIDYLKGSGELSAADAELLETHPNIVEELEGYKDFVAIYTFDDAGFVEFAAEVLRRPAEIVAAWANRESKVLEKNYPGDWFK